MDGGQSARSDLLLRLVGRRPRRAGAARGGVLVVVVALAHVAQLLREVQVADQEEERDDEQRDAEAEARRRRDGNRRAIT